MKKRKFVKVFLSVVLCSVLAISIAAVSKFSKDSVASKESAATVGSPELVNSNGSILDKEYCLSEFSFSLKLPQNWIVRDKGKNEVEGSLQSVVIYGDSGEILTMKVYAKPVNVEDFLRTNLSIGPSDLNAAKSVISGCNGYSWTKTDVHGRVDGGMVVFFNEKNLFVLNFSGKEKSDALALDGIIHSIYAGQNGPTALAFDSTAIKYPGEDIATIQASCCNLTDSYTNNYPCCTSPNGNCTWYCEYRVAGNDNFPWYGNANTWIYYSTYPEGGTIPEVGAIMVFDSGWYTYGHVAYVTGINADGSINVNEQGCDAYCTRSGSYTTTQLRSYLAGYIYRDGTAPNPTAKTISGTIGSPIIVDDFNFSSTYYFQAYGPGIGSMGWGTYYGGYNNFFHWTTTTSSLVNYCRWCFYISTAGTYKIEAYIPAIHATANVRYHLDGSATEIGTINQSLYSDQWVQIGSNRSLTAGTHNIYVYDNECGGSGTDIACDALRFTRQS